MIFELVSKGQKEPIDRVDSALVLKLKKHILWVGNNC